jgi:NADPH2:quinone reductase
MSESTMRAVVITGHGGPEVLAIHNVPKPEPGPGQIRVAVEACALNRADLLQRMGHYPAPPGTPQDIPGLEYAGTVEALGPGTQLWSIGDKVMGIAPGGAQAEKIVVHAREAIRAPKNLSTTDAGAIPEAFLTAYDAIVLQAQLAAGDSLLIHAAASGVGTAAIQLSRLVGARTIGTIRTDSKHAQCGMLGLDHSIGTSNGGFLDGVMDFTGGRGVDVILDLVGAAYLDQNLKALAQRGTLITVGLLGGTRAEIPLNRLMAKRLRWMGTVLRARPLEEKIALARLFEQRMVPAFESGDIKPVVDCIFDAENVADAHHYMASNTNVGKIVLTWTD